MTDGLLLGPGAGFQISGAGMTLKVGDEHSRAWSAFETVVCPGFDVGAHLHNHAEEFFYILDGELDLLAFEPRAEPAGDWRDWESANGLRVMRGRPGAAMFVPAGCPHAFANPGRGPARMLFLVSPPGHEHYGSQFRVFRNCHRLNRIERTKSSQNDLPEATSRKRRRARANRGP